MSRATLIVSTSSTRCKNVLLQRLSQKLPDIRHRILRDHHSLTQNQHVGANFLYHLQHMRAIKHHPALLPERLHQVLENQCRSNVQSRERFIENKNLWIIHDRRDQQNALPHSLRVRSNAGMPARMHREQFQQGIDLASRGRDAAIPRSVPISSRYSQPVRYGYR